MGAQVESTIGPPVLGYLKRSRVLRRAVEDPPIQVAFHVMGGAGLGLLAAHMLALPIAVAVGILLLAAAVLGHWYAVWSDQRES